MKVFRSAWVLPITAPPIRDGWVSVDKGLITGLGGDPPAGARDLGATVVLPALVNAHTHLELSYLRDAVPPADRFVDWIRLLIGSRRKFPDPQDPVILDAARAAIDEARASGTGLVGDVSNTLVTVPLLREAGMRARVFHELLGFDVEDAVERVRRARWAVGQQPEESAVQVSLAPHAPYSVSPALFAAIREDLDGHPNDVSTVHLSESADEVEFIAAGTGAWRDVLLELGSWTESWRPPGGSPVQYLANLGFLDARVLAVHAVQCSRDDLHLLRALGATVVSCPRSNRHVGVGSPPLDLFYECGVRVAFGTDSLASVSDLNLFAELAAARQSAPTVLARELLASGTIHGARALGFGDRLGSIERGKEAALLAVQVPEHVDDVEEYLVGGVVPDAVRWVD